MGALYPILTAMMSDYETLPDSVYRKLANNRLGATSLLDTLVFGRRSGEHASDMAKDRPHRPVTDAAADGDRDSIQRLLDNGDGEMFGKLRQAMGKTMDQHLAVFRDRQGMESALAEIRHLKERFTTVWVQDKGKTFNTNLIFTLELGFMLDCAETIALSGLERKESRGAHTRTDMPDRNDDEWLKHIMVKHTPDGPEIEYSPVVITEWQPEVRAY